MTTGKIISSIFILLAGLAVFMFGLKTMSERLEKQAGRKLRKLFNKATGNKLMGVGVGAGVTAIIQSSSATTVMVVGLVNAGILSLAQAASIIMGANIGTTVTALLISLPITEFVAATGLVGIFLVMFTQKRRIQEIGYIIIGLSMIFTGLLVMANAMKEFAALEGIKLFFAATSNKFLLIMLGLIVTALIQSSSATTGILITLAGTGLMGIESAIFVVLGINIGTCITALLASIGANVNAQRASAIHLMFNISGTVIFGIFLSFAVIRNGIINALTNLGSILPNEGLGAQIAAFHIFFNVSTTLLLLPFINILVKLSFKIIKNKKQTKSLHGFEYLNEILLKSTPSMAITQVKKEIIRMTRMAKENLDIAMNAVINRDLKNYDKFAKTEDYIDWLNREIPFFLAKLSSRHIAYEDEKIVSSFYHVIIDIERIGDYAENIIEYAQRMETEDIEFSQDALKNINSMYNKIQKLYNLAVNGFETKNLSLAHEIDILEDLIDNYKRNLSEEHIKRLNEGTCLAPSGAIFLSLVSNLERVADHTTNIFNSVRKYRKEVKIYR